VIKSFRHKGLDRFFTKSDRNKIDAREADRIRWNLDRLDATTKPEDMNLPGFGFHGFSGKLKGAFAVSVSGNWRITFRFADADAIEGKLEDYH
jgi:proteic killer suppression protein